MGKISAKQKAETHVFYGVSAPFTTQEIHSTRLLIPLPMRTGRSSAISAGNPIVTCHCASRLLAGVSAIYHCAKVSFSKHTDPKYKVHRNPVFRVCTLFVSMAHLGYEFEEFISKNGILKNFYLGYVYFYRRVPSH